MRLRIIAAIAGTALLFGQPVLAQNTEQDLINKYLKKAERKQTKKLYWLSGNFTLNRINRNNDYNKFATLSSSHFSNAQVNWLDKGSSFGLELGWLFNKRFSWTIGGEYWMKLGQNETGSFDYTPPVGGNVIISDLISEIKVFGVTSGVQFYVMNPPTIANQLTKMAVKIGAGFGYYQASWDLWDQYENLNLSSSQPATTNATFKDNALGLNLNFGVEYPFNVGGMALGVDLQYLYLNFNNVAWYNSVGQEIVATYGGNTESRVNLGLSGVRGKIELKKFFGW